MQMTANRKLVRSKLTPEQLRAEEWLYDETIDHPELMMLVHGMAGLIAAQQPTLGYWDTLVEALKRI